MIRRIVRAILALACLAMCRPVVAAEPPNAAWHTIADNDLLLLELADGHRVVIRLAADYAPQHVANIRKLALAHWWDNTRIYRVQDNWVVQWGAASQDKPLPPTIEALPAPEADFPVRPLAQVLPGHDAYSAQSGLTADGWPLATTGGRSWIAHCYGTVGVVKGPAPDTGTGAELFASIGATRRIDRAYPVIGRVIDGMDTLSALPRSRATLGFFATASEAIPVITARLASDVPQDQRAHYQYLAADSAAVAAAISSLLHPAAPRVMLGGIDVCDVPLDVRAAPTGASQQRLSSMPRHDQ